MYVWCVYDERMDGWMRIWWNDDEWFRRNRIEIEIDFTTRPDFQSPLFSPNELRLRAISNLVLRVFLPFLNLRLSSIPL